jgi:hypothetical protein
MKKIYSFTLIILFGLTHMAGAQTKVFKEVSEDISSDMKVILQGQALVGYVVLTQLEKASADSFNYKLSIIDENLNDIGIVNFRQEKLFLQEVAFENDKLCLSYLKSNIIGREFKNGKEFDNFEPSNSIFYQFLSLDGKITNTNEEKLKLATNDYLNYSYVRSKKKFTYQGDFSGKVDLKNIPGVGFVTYFSNGSNQQMVAYDFEGKSLWERKLAINGAYSFLCNSENLYLLHTAKDNRKSISCLNAKDGKESFEINLNDGNGNTLNILKWDFDPQTGKPYLSGTINNGRSSEVYSANKFAKNPTIGVFTIDITGNTKESVKKKMTFWNDGNQALISKKGRITDNNVYFYFINSFKDFDNNTYYVSPELIRKIKPSSFVWPILVIGPAVANSIINKKNYPDDPTVSSLNTVGIALGALAIPSTARILGFHKWKAKNTMVIKVTPKGIMSLENTLPAEDTKFVGGRLYASSLLNNRLIYSIDNPATKTNYIITTDKQNVAIYNVKKKKIDRNIPFKSGNVNTLILPAKEGHIMVIEKNKKERYTRLSIEALN